MVQHGCSKFSRFTGHLPENNARGERPAGENQQRAGGWPDSLPERDGNMWVNIDDEQAVNLDQFASLKIENKPGPDGKAKWAVVGRRPLAEGKSDEIVILQVENKERAILGLAGILRQVQG